MPSGRINRVYFVGAGFSAGMGYPVGQTLLPRLLEWLKHRDDHDQYEGRRGKYAPEEGPNDARARKNLAQRIERFLAEYLKPYAPSGLNSKILDDNWINSIPVASFFSICQALSENASLFGADVVGELSDERTIGLYDSLAAAIRTYFLDLSLISRKRRPKYVNQIFASRSFDPSSSVVVNFNWDEELDALFSGRHGLDYTLGSWRATSSNKPAALMLKPHGSVGWYDVSSGGSLSNRAIRLGNKLGYFVAENDPRIKKEAMRIKAFYEIEMPKRRDKSPYGFFEAPPAIAAPTFAKRFDFAEQRLIWSDVVEVCRDAKEFVFLGYTLPPDDYLTRAAIAKALARRDSRRRVKCLAIGRDIDRCFEDFQKSFGGSLDRGRHFRNWTFGYHDHPKTFPSRDVGEALEEELADAEISR